MIQVISLPQVQPNADIEILYTKKMKSTLSEHNWWTSWAFQSFSPTLHSRLAIRLPEGMKFSQDARGAKPEGEVHQEGDHRIYTWTMRNLPPLRAEPGAPPAAARRPEVF